MPTFTGETVDQAIKKGLASLGINRADAAISIIEEGKKGFLGIGKKEAIVSINAKEKEEEIQVTTEIIEEPEIESEVMIEYQEPVKVEIKETPVESQDISLDEAITKLSVYLTDITTALGAPAMTRVQRNDNHVVLHLDTDKKGLLIGKHGKVLNAIQYLSQVYIHRLVKNRLTVIVNVGDYRERREAIIKRLANQAVHKVRDTTQPVFLEPMPAFERKQVHSILSNEKDIKTHSEGNEPHRYLVVELKK
ncbi:MULTISPECIES: RNA-binding cell elongation regulator Jag/EloR [Enterococcaceae]|uniref:RNA-binding cell elongation regulator Jag/EloR n=1 Tax=Enterococcaceae TaxID=81852 RepID=UPI000E49B814|nr:MULTISPECIES: RNA-binding cell elongation regulator Jag/EloR [Enterococcaceae]MCI0131330.1 protein jag [Vagococcus sp. CY53-2]RGI29034.1 protein jag [Melissococcus sp. OM08-11BH]UNM89535.1 protein jag [Vagococcus sp. CY52-2]